MGLRAGLDWWGKSRPTGIRSPDRPARRQSLYRLRYPALLRFLFTQIIFPAFSGSASFFARREEQCENDVKENASLSTQ